MKKEILSELSTDKLEQRKRLLTGACIGCAIVYLLAIAVMIYLVSSKGLKNVSIAALIPLFGFPMACINIVVNLNSVNKELKLRN